MSNIIHSRSVFLLPLSYKTGGVLCTRSTAHEIKNKVEYGNPSLAQSLFHALTHSHRMTLRATTMQQFGYKRGIGK